MPLRQRGDGAVPRRCPGLDKISALPVCLDHFFLFPGRAPSGKSSPSLSCKGGVLVVKDFPFLDLSFPLCKMDLLGCMTS